ncbi:IS30 family transposase [Psychromonas algarum]|uniref:IS30 family transposase n=1 Tax=Psychromonas algarum TaxID=2555643 RepID=UPI0014197735|nr:IS30 family transposase [Psychromonas sp. RZ22]
MQDIQLKGGGFTITADNAKEFTFHEVMTEHSKCGSYFATPYCSWQRGLNENANELLRQYWQKLTGFKNISQTEVEGVIVNLNDRSRKKLNFKAPANLMAEHIIAIAT